MANLHMEKHPDKTFIGRISRGFDFLGYWFSPAGLGVAPKTMERCVERVSRLYGQGADFARIGEYVRHWWRWVRCGVDRIFVGAVRLFWGFAGALQVELTHPTRSAIALLGWGATLPNTHPTSTGDRSFFL